MTAMDSETSVGDHLDDAMRKAGFTSQAALSRAAGVPQPTINRILKGTVGKRGPETETLKRLAQACGVGFTWLNEGTSPEDPRGPTLTDRQLEWLRLLDGLCAADIEEFSGLIRLRQARNLAVIAELCPEKAR
ncbi:helix-turn-helix transcriptional regulator [Noviherbaspirillum sp. CPCC 100848]|uniref:Helix-turn-helix transcriptional regulator n=1 Tax=Noviherbaspirillum album TaxID=3080276 RepID=A0ABU6J3X9_9BURK|nr:helix-turn-helix transcriptional regulator [Noviherbaspirillum sp. CPCC 100848]MEC4718158.1 helix-turn-helix transcriptional regulator [Noviherbaspirillum sp. CPCC 100848]